MGARVFRVAHAAWAIGACWAAFGAVVPAPLHAQSRAGEAGSQAPVFEARARVRAHMVATNGEDPTASGTEVDLRHRNKDLEEVAEAVIEVPGVRTQSSGGVGAFTSVALRGADVGHTAVLLGTIPLNTPDSGAFDLSLLPASSLDAVEVYRGGVPLWFDQGAIGGVVRYVPARGRGRSFRGDLQTGSFGHLEARATASIEGQREGSPALLTHAAVARADNDYRYLHDDMRLVSGDESIRRQTNGQVDLGSGLLHGELDVASGRMEVVLAGQGRTEGVPGSLSHEWERTRRQRVWLLGGLGWNRIVTNDAGEARSRIQIQAGGGHHRNRFSDPDKRSSGNGAETDDGWTHAYARLAYGARVWPWLEPSLVSTIGYHRYDPDNPREPTIPSRTSRRLTGGFGLEPRMFGRIGGVPVEVRPSALLQLSHTHVDFPRAGDETLRDDTTFVPTFRLAVAAAPLAPLTLSASVYSGMRLPSIVELFGDRVFVLPNPRLLPETSIGADAGAVVAGRAGAVMGRAELRAFATWIDDLIQARYDSPNTLFHDNIGSGRVLGIEAGLSGQLGPHLSLSGSLTALSSRSQAERPLPLRPPLQGLVRPEVHFSLPGIERLTVFGELHHVAFAYRDVDALRYLPGRTLVGMGVRALLFDGHVALQLRAKNLLDQIQNDLGQNITDVVGRPLPSRQVLLSLSVLEGE